MFKLIDSITEKYVKWTFNEEVEEELSKYSPFNGELRKIKDLHLSLKEMEKQHNEYYKKISR